MIIKKHNNNGRLILALCDASLLNKKIETDELILDLSSSFYKGEKTTEEELKDLFKKTYILNAVGEKCISFLINQKVVSEKNIKKINGIPYLQLIFE